jgi:small ligand-binding sensory domain FIST
LIITDNGGKRQLWGDANYQLRWVARLVSVIGFGGFHVLGEVLIGRCSRAMLAGELKGFREPTDGRLGRAHDGDGL